MKLARVTQDDFRPRPNRPHNPSHSNIGFAILLQVAHIFAVDLRAQNSETAARIRSTGTAHIEKARPIRNLHHIVDVSCDADIFVDVSCRFINGITGLGCEGSRR